MIIIIYSQYKVYLRTRLIQNSSENLKFPLRIFALLANSRSTRISYTKLLTIRPSCEHLCKSANRPSPFLLDSSGLRTNSSNKTNFKSDAIFFILTQKLHTLRRLSNHGRLKPYKFSYSANATRTFSRFDHLRNVTGISNPSRLSDNKRNFQRQFDISEYVLFVRK